MPSNDRIAIAELRCNRVTSYARVLFLLLSCRGNVNDKNGNILMKITETPHLALLHNIECYLFINNSFIAAKDI